MVSVAAVLRMPELRLTLRAGRQQLQRPISRIYGTELPDPGRFLSGGELVISGLLWFGDDSDVPGFVGALEAAGVACLIACDAETGVIPPALVAECQARSVPLLEAKPDLSFAVITDRVGLELASERVGGAAANRGRRRGLVTAVTRGIAPADLLSLGAEQLAAPCWVLTPAGRVVASSGPELPDERRLQLVHEFLLADQSPKTVRSRLAGDTGGPYSLLPVEDPSGPDLTRWFLVVGGGRKLTAPPYDEVAAELTSLIALQRSRQQDSRRIANRIVGPLLRSVLAGTARPGELVSAAAAAGIDTEQPVRVLAMSAPGFSPGVASAVLEELVMPLEPPALVGVVGEEVYALVPVGDQANVAELVEAGLRVLEPGLRGERVVVGVSTPSAVAELRGAVQEARQARQVGEARTGRSCVVAGEEIAVHQLLLAAVPEEVRRALRRRVLGPVMDYDAEHGVNLLETLTVFLECSCSWTQAAAKLHVHVNTLRYRIGRVQDLIGVSLGSFSERVDVYLALCAAPGEE